MTQNFAKSTMRWHCLQHLLDEGPGHAADWLAAHGRSLLLSCLKSNPVFSDLADFDGLLVLSGAMSVHNEAVDGEQGAVLFRFGNCLGRVRVAGAQALCKSGVGRVGVVEHRQNLFRLHHKVG